MINLEDIQLGKTYYIAFIYDKGSFEVNEITPKKVFIDAEGRGSHIINVVYEEDKSKIYWINRNWTMNEFEPDFLKPIVYIFDNFKDTMRCIELCKEEKIKDIQKEIREKEQQIVEICKNHASFLTKYIDKI